MKLTIYADTTDELRSQVAHLARFVGLPVGDAPEPAAPADLPAAPVTPVATNGQARSPGRPRKTPAPVDTTAAAVAPSPAAPTPAEPATATMLPLCKLHAGLYPEIKAIPAEPSACAKCAAAAEGPKPIGGSGKAMTLDEVKAIANELGESRADGWDTCFKILDSMGVESLTGADGTKALDPSQYEEFARQFSAAMAPGPVATKPARKAL